MNKEDFTKFVIPALIVIIAIIAVVILGGIASGNPDGFEWAFFEFAGIHEPEEGFSLFSFGEGPVADLVAGITGIGIILVAALACFWFTSRKSE